MYFWWNIHFILILSQTTAVNNYDNGHELKYQKNWKTRNLQKRVIIYSSI